MAEVILFQEASLPQFEVSQVDGGKEHSTPVSALERNDSVAAHQPTDSTALYLPISSLVVDNMDPGSGDLKTLQIKPEQDSQTARNPEESAKPVGVKSGPATMPSSRADKRGGKARRKAKAKKKQVEKEQARKETDQQLGLHGIQCHT